MRVILLVLGCHTDLSVDTADRPGHGDDSGDSGDTDDSGDGSPLACDELNGQTLDQTLLSGFDGSEDFAFDLDGWVVHVDDYGALVRENRDGDREVIATGLGTASGTRVLPDGSIAVNSVERGAILKVTPDGAVSPLVSGLAYPNGLELGLDGYLYVAENGADTVRRVDPETGENEVIGRGMIAPNGLSFDLAHETLYVGSFGGGMVYALDRDADGGWDEPRIQGMKPGVEAPVDDCADRQEGEQCMLLTGGYGACELDGDELSCTFTADEAACDGLAVGDTCTTQVNGASHTSVCVEGRNGDDGVWCAPIDPERIVACDGQPVWGACTWDGEPGYCEASWDGTIGCVGQTEYTDAYYTPCAGEEFEAGDACVVADPIKPLAGECTVYSYGSLICYPAASMAAGGFDGVTADSCGNVYATEYGPGIVWRWPPDGAEAEALLDLRSTWIPNMHWGLGTGGWERTTLYIIKRTGGFVEAPIGVEGKVDALEVLTAR